MTLEFFFENAGWNIITTNISNHWVKTLEPYTAKTFNFSESGLSFEHLVSSAILETPLPPHKRNHGFAYLINLTVVTDLEKQANIWNWTHLMLSFNFIIELYTTSDTY